MNPETFTGKSSEGSTFESTFVAAGRRDQVIFSSMVLDVSVAEAVAPTICLQASGVSNDCGRTNAKNAIDFNPG